MSKKSKTSVKDIEAELTHLYETDINNPRIYELLKQLANIFIYQNGWIYGYSDRESVCHNVAADTYMRLLKGNTKITKWMYYISISIKRSYISAQKKIEHQIFDTSDNPELRKSIINMCTGSSKSFSDDFNSIYKVSFLENIDTIIRQAVNNTKFKSDSKEWLTIYTNVCLSLCYDKPVYFRISKELRPYVQLVINQFKDMFINSEFVKNIFDEEDEDLPSLLFYDEQSVKDTDRKRDV